MTQSALFTSITHALSAILTFLAAVRAEHLAAVNTFVHTIITEHFVTVIAPYLARIADARVAINIRARIQAVTAQCSSAIARVGTLYTYAGFALIAIRHAVIT